MDSPLSITPELEARIHQTLEDIKADIIAYDERHALQAVDDGLTTDQRAMAALLRPERFSGEHAVAQMWLLNSKTARVWSRRRP